MPSDRFAGPLPERADVVVIGAGSAGCVVARRLADAGARVALLEAGPVDDEPAILDPLRMFELWGLFEPSPLDWGYDSVEQAHLAGRRVHQTRGKVLGGSSSVNGMYHVRGHRHDYDTWAHLGNAGWRHEDVLPLFKRSEDFDGAVSKHRGTGGPLSVFSDYEPHPLSAAIIEAAVQAGHPRNPDYNAHDTAGVAPIQLNARAGERHSSARAFIYPIAQAPNLTVRTGCHVQRLLVEDGRCVGVELMRDSARETISATEVVLSAGTFDSPKLLMLSGIGPAAELDAHGIATVADLPGVGRNLQDHVFSPLVFAAARPLPPAVPQVPIYHVHMFFHSRAGLPAPDLQSLFGHMPHYPEGYQGPEAAFTLTSMLNRPASRGTVQLASADPAAAPLIDPNYGSCDADLDAIASGLEQLRDVAAQTALAPWRGKELAPGPGVATRAQLRDYVRATMSTIYHPAGSCRMGTDELAVVDPSLRVHGVDGLWIADASVMPLITSGNTHAPTVMIGERAADNVGQALGAGQAEALAVGAA